MAYVELVTYVTSLPAPEPVVIEEPVVTEPAQVEQAPLAAGSGECGGATNGADQYIGRETQGSSDPVNQDNLEGSGAHGCFQITPGTWEASCSDLGDLQGSSADAQAQCASRLPLSAWG